LSSNEVSSKEQSVKEEPAVEADGLVKTFPGGVTALDGVSFSIPQGTVFGLLGPNGAGKTTVVRILTTIIHPDRGHARVLGNDVVARPDSVRRSIGLAGQYAAVDENLTGRENLMMVARLTDVVGRARGPRVAELLERFGLTDAADRPVKTYSGGMRRRVDVAAALVHRPPVLFLDEPTTGLDPRSRNDVWNLIEELVADGTTVLLTTQYLEEADRLADTIAVVDEGHVIASGTSTELKASLGSTVLELSFAGDRAATRAANALTKAGHSVSRNGSPRIELPVKDGSGAVIEILRGLDASRIKPSGLTVREPTLDDVFLAITGRRRHADTEPNGAVEGAAAPRKGARR
jgi:daunorubicin resistance ABC transporter ATP-binding subunit